ncbi:ABC transporter ATP-binding protein [Thermodesulfobacteriota bacterium]
MILQIESISKAFGGIHALNDVSINIKKGQIYGVIGPNGAGKSTLFQIISGVLKPDSGEIIFDNTAITGFPSHKVSRVGIGYVFQESFLFDDMTLFENMLVSGNTPLNNGLLSLLPFYQSKKAEQFKKKIRDTLKIFGLDMKTELFPGHLSYGDRRRALIAHVLINGASLILLDEPSAGMNSIEREELSNDILGMQKNGHTIIIIEHNLRLIMGICDSISVLNFGRVICQGTPGEISNDESVIEAYIGKKSG